MATGDAGTAIAKIDPRQNNLKTLFEKSKGAIAQVLPKHLTADRILKVTLAATSRTPKLLECTQESILHSVMLAAQLGIEPGGPLGHGYLVPFNAKVKTEEDGRKREYYRMECQLIIGYRGLIDLARRSGQIDSIEARAVYEKDKFRFALGLIQVLEHEPYLDGDPGKLVCVYAIARIKGSLPQIEVMSRAQINRIKDGSKSPYVWADHYDEMARKTVVRRICKYLPLTVELATALELDEPQETALDASAFSAITVDCAPDEGGLVDKLKGKAQAAQQTSAPPAPDFAKRLSEAPTRPELERIWEDARATLVGDELDAATRAYDKRVEELRVAAGH